MNEIITGDCLEVMKGFEAESIDLIVTDPPYGLEFMGKSWDKAVPSVAIWKECFRVLKAGAFAFVMCAPRLRLYSIGVLIKPSYLRPLIAYLPSSNFPKVLGLHVFAPYLSISLSI